MSQKRKSNGSLTWLLPCLFVVALFAWPLFSLPGPLKLLEIPWVILLAAGWYGLHVRAQRRRRASLPPRRQPAADADPASPAAQRSAST